MTPTTVDKLLNWYRQNGRSLPWRGADDPYKIWVAEVMLQQTRVETVKPYYQRWLQRFPTVTDLAQADQDEVLNLWEGLGYYRRARYLQRAAQIVVEQHGGKLPRTVADLKELPGVGEYTSAAIASIAFDADALALDGNLKRVLARLFDVDALLGSAAADAQLRRAGESMLPAGKAAAFNQALMDLGATVCLPRQPHCEQCPLEADCLARQRGVETERPVRQPANERPHVTRAAAVLSAGDHVLIVRRPEQALLGGMWEFPGAEVEQDEKREAKLVREIKQALELQLGRLSPIGEYKHSYSHYHVTAYAYRAEIARSERTVRERIEAKWVGLDELDQYPMGKIDRSIADDLQQGQSGSQEEEENEA